jgi:mycofactocin system transcriptional regulator
MVSQQVRDSGPAPDPVRPVRAAEPRSGRPRSTSRHALEQIALELFEEQGFEATTVEQITDRAGISRRTFFRYFDSKAAVLWSEFDLEVDTLHGLLAGADPGLGLTAAIREAVLKANHYEVDDVGELRARMQVIANTPALGASANVHYDGWAGALAAFAARRLGQHEHDLIPQAIGFSALGVCRAAFDAWIARRDTDLISYLDAALTAWCTGFAHLDTIPT